MPPITIDCKFESADDSGNDNVTTTRHRQHSAKPGCGTDCRPLLAVNSGSLLTSVTEYPQVNVTVHSPRLRDDRVVCVDRCHDGVPVAMEDDTWQVAAWG